MSEEIKKDLEHLDHLSKRMETEESGMLRYIFDFKKTMIQNKLRWKVEKIEKRLEELIHKLEKKI